MKIVIYLAGIYNLLFALFHVGFWKMFNWDVELKKLTPDNSAVMQALNVHIIYYLLFTALVCFVFPAELRNTKLGSVFLLGCSFFWLLRTVLQFILFPVNGFASILGAFLFFGTGVVLFALPVFK